MVKVRIVITYANAYLDIPETYATLSRKVGVPKENAAALARKLGASICPTNPTGVYEWHVFEEQLVEGLLVENAEVFRPVRSAGLLLVDDDWKKGPLQ